MGTQRLWRATVIFDLYVSAETECDARRIANFNAASQCGDLLGPVGPIAEVRAMDKLTTDDAESVPYRDGIDRGDYRTCGEVLAEAIRDRRPDDLPGQGKLFDGDESSCK